MPIDSIFGRAPLHPFPFPCPLRLLPLRLRLAFALWYMYRTSSILMNQFRPTLLAGFRLQIQKRLPCI